MSAPILVADVGGTNARFAIASPQEGGGAALACPMKLRPEDFENIRDAIDAYFEMSDCERPRQACIAVAGPVHGTDIALTNARWSFRTDELAQRLAMDQVHAVNDWAAVACGAQSAPADETSLVAAGVADPDAPVLAVGPGTGLGMGFLVRGRHDGSNSGSGVGAARDIVVDTEGGHVAFSPRDEREVAIWRFIREEHPYVSFERLLSGRGLVSIHRALCAEAGVARANLSPDEITAAALSDASDLPIAREAVDAFCAITGSYAASMTVAIGARGGVFLGGGILPRVRSLLESGKFLERFRDVGQMSHYVADVPVTLLHHTDRTALAGAARLAWDCGDQI